ncbi:DHHW family protein [Brachyspira pilosicoli]|uniref:DHHW family protein n=1 Tax=Brachyspira pilosicoli TaxID=52584 RepID=UPI0024920E74|nr:DHHW family protein [Brachyspira pilosicoli]
MKNIKLFNKILLSIGIIFITVILILFVLGSFNRIGYLSEFKINIDNTLKLNVFNLESIKESFTIDNVLDEISITNYLATNIYITNYSYDFRIKYYSKIFRNSDIYGVYLNTTSLPDYIRDIQFDKKGSPFGILVSSEIIKQEKIDSIQYFLQIKYHLFVIIIMSIYLSIILLYKFGFIIIDFIKIIYNIKSLKKINFKNKYVYILIMFLCFLIMPNIIYKVFYDKFDHTNYENRNFAKKPEFDLKKLDNYPKLYETYFNDYIPFRNELVMMKNLLDFYVFRNFIYNKGILGKNNWLFFDDTEWDFNKNYYIGNDFEYTKNIITMKENLVSFRDELKKRDIEFVFLICPQKHYIYTNYMPDYLNSIRKTTNVVTDKLLNYLKENTDIKVVYSRDELIKYKDKYQLYYKADPHWNNLAGYIAYQELMKEIGMNYVDISTLSITKTNLSIISGAFANFVALSKINEYKYDIEYELKTIDNKVDTVIPWTNIFIIESEEKNDNPNLLCFRDSFIGRMGYFKYDFKHSTFVNLDLFNPKDMEKVLNDDVDIVIFETVENKLERRLLRTMPEYTKEIKKINNSIVKTNITIAK